MPVSSAVHGVSPKSDHARPDQSLPTTTSPTMATRSGTSSNTRNGSMRAPTVTKKKAPRVSRSGSSRASVSWAKSEVLMSRPARKAPRASDSPTAWVSAAVPSPMASATSRNSSWLRVRATRVSTGETMRAATIDERHQDEAGDRQPLADREQAIGARAHPAPA